MLSSREFLQTQHKKIILQYNLRDFILLFFYYHATIFLYDTQAAQMIIYVIICAAFFLLFKRLAERGATNETNEKVGKNLG